MKRVISFSVDEELYERFKSIVPPSVRSEFLEKILYVFIYQQSNESVKQWIREKIFIKESRHLKELQRAIGRSVIHREKIREDVLNRTPEKYWGMVNEIFDREVRIEKMLRGETNETWKAYSYIQD